MPLLRRSIWPTFFISAIHSGNASLGAADEDYEGLPEFLRLAVDAPVLLTKNLNVVIGLANGTSGRIVRILKFSELSQDEDINQTFVDCIIVDFQAYKGKSFIPSHPTWVPIFRLSISHKGGERSQFALRLAAGVSIHKNQGVTLYSVFVDIGSKEFACGLSFVALSRCHILEGIYLEDSNFLIFWILCRSVYFVFYQNGRSFV